MPHPKAAGSADKDFGEAAAPTSEGHRIGAHLMVGDVFHLNFPFFPVFQGKNDLLNVLPHLVGAKMTDRQGQHTLESFAVFIRTIEDAVLSHETVGAKGTGRRPEIFKIEPAEAFRMEPPSR